MTISVVEASVNKGPVSWHKSGFGMNPEYPEKPSKLSRDRRKLRPRPHEDDCKRKR